MDKMEYYLKTLKCLVLVVAHHFCSCQLCRADAEAVEASVRHNEQVSIQINY